MPPSPVSEWEANDGLLLRGYRSGDTRWIEAASVATYAFSSTGSVTASDVAAPEEAVRDVWLRSVLPLVVQARGTQVLHASAVRRRDGSIVALCGHATAGKSTLAAALRQRLGLELVADDALAFELVEGAAVARPLPHRVRLRPASAEALGLPTIAGEAASEGPAPFASLVILRPRPGGSPTRVARLRRAEAFGALMPHAYCFALEDGKEALATAYGELCRAVTVHRLDFPQQLGRLGEAVATLAPLTL